MRTWTLAVLINLAIPAALLAQAEEVVWTRPEGVSVSGSTITKTGVLAAVQDWSTLAAH